MPKKKSDKLIATRNCFPKHNSLKRAINEVYSATAAGAACTARAVATDTPDHVQELCSAILRCDVSALAQALYTLLELVSISARRTGFSHGMHWRNGRCH